MGQTLGLSHDGTTALGYYESRGSGADGWVPILGADDYQPVVQFSRAEYAGANHAQDDVAIITAARNFPDIPDDHGTSPASARS